MTKTLTDKWKKGKIKEGFYYVHFCTGEIVYRHLSGNKPDKEFIDLGCFQEVLAPVPSYDEYKQLVSKTEQLEKRLEIATEALKEVVVASDNYRFCQSVGYKNLAEEALKEMEGVK